MRKFFAALLVVFMVTAAAATTIESEQLFLDLEDSTAEATVEVEDLTSSQFTYLTSADVSSADASTNGEQMNCSIEELSLGSEIRCDTELEENFTVNINYTFESLVSNGGVSKTLRYSHPFYRPTENFRLRVALPPGAGLTERNASEPAISPGDGQTGSDGQRIFVEWEKRPQIGDTLSFQIDYQNYNDSGTNYLQILGLLTLISLAAGLGFLYWRRRNMEDIETVYGDLSEDEKDVIQLLKDNDGEMLQKDVVNSTDYSKAKISGVVSELVEKEIVEKEKEGRSNKLKISGKYRF